MVLADPLVTMNAVGGKLANVAAKTGEKRRNARNDLVGQKALAVY
jgi:hypothetical protein